MIHKDNIHHGDTEGPEDFWDILQKWKAGSRFNEESFTLCVSLANLLPFNKESVLIT